MISRIIHTAERLWDCIGTLDGTLGVTLGTLVDVLDGTLDSTLVGTLEGTLEGILEGTLVGTLVGILVGTLVNGNEDSGCCMGTIFDLRFLSRCPLLPGTSSTRTVYSCLALGPRARLPSATSTDWFLDRVGLKTLTDSWEDELSLVREVRVDEWCRPSSVSYRQGCSSGIGLWCLLGARDRPWSLSLVGGTGGRSKGTGVSGGGYAKCPARVEWWCRWL